MRAFLKITAAAVAFAALPASAVPVLTSASVTGPTGTVWNTTADSFYNLFIRHPTDQGYVNSNDNFSGISLGGLATDGDFQITGDGWPTGASAHYTNSDPYYNLTLVLTEAGKSLTLTGKYTPGTQEFVGLTGSGILNGVKYTLDSFDWTRGTTNLVGGYTYAGRIGQTGGSARDYQGTFSLSSGGVPEPATWGLMILGFGGVAGAMRRRRSTTLATA
ncbi:PEPxxWA-CTERM sorting domain-containing protein [Sphingomonas sp. MMSM20]|uniref:PEPxxWA-CTERM sorting domain-containing protein n=2 Tax=Sphingomonas TaxID=13687 RepID=UPI0015CAF144|nr:PEPxxWA-CTERM sorting domain-containing protein [Sphingomonas lycopersici]MCW6531713.1 PEPxxWA-CTERM sorting domain-containing protein [Sphingomonas lycopersici]